MPESDEIRVTPVTLLEFEWPIEARTLQEAREIMQMRGITNVRTMTIAEFEAAYGRD